MTYETYFRNLDAQIGVIETERDEARYWARRLLRDRDKYWAWLEDMNAEILALRAELEAVKYLRVENGGLHADRAILTATVDALDAEIVRLRAELTDKELRLQVLTNAAMCLREAKTQQPASLSHSESNAEGAIFRYTHTEPQVVRLPPQNTSIVLDRAAKFLIGEAERMRNFYRNTDASTED